MTELAPEEARLIKRFLQAQAAEKAAATNTLLAYERDYALNFLAIAICLLAIKGLAIEVPSK